MITKWRPSWIRHLGFLDFSKTSGKQQNEAQKNNNKARFSLATQVQAQAQE